jgi:hypothetical protein
LGFDEDLGSLETGFPIFAIKRSYIIRQDLESIAGVSFTIYFLVEA